MQSGRKQKKVNHDREHQSDRSDAIASSTLRGRQKVDPVTRERSDAPGAISRSALRMKRLVDPISGEDSSAPGAVPYYKYRDQLPVNKYTGLSCDASDPDAVRYSTWRSQQPVNKRNGEACAADHPDAVPFHKYRELQPVNKLTGKKCEPDDPYATTRYEYKASKKKIKALDPASEKTSETLDAIADATRSEKKYVNSENGDPCDYDHPKAITREAHRSRLRRAKAKLAKAVAAAIKTEQEDAQLAKISKVVTQLDRENFKKVARILRGDDQTPDNCAYLVKAFIDYLLTAEMPTQPAPANPASLEQLTFVYLTGKTGVEIKSEPSEFDPPRKVRMVESIVTSWIDRNTLFGTYAPAGEIPREDGEGRVDLTATPTYDIDYYEQNTILFTELNTALKNEAKNNGGVSFGMVDIAPCGKYVKELRHCIAYYATSDEVVFIDCQEPEPVFEKIEDVFAFVAIKKRVSVDTFGNDVFYTPLCPNLTKDKESKSEKDKTLKRKEADQASDRPNKRQKTSSDSSGQSTPENIQEQPSITPRSLSITFFAPANDAMELVHTDSMDTSTIVGASKFSLPVPGVPFND